jgi:hypothetical protein
MSETPIRTAVLDRYEDGWGIVFFDDAPETPVSIARSHFAKRKPKEGTYLRIEMRGDEILSITVDKAATEAARLRIQEKLARLRRGDHLTEPPEP